MKIVSVILWITVVQLILWVESAEANNLEEMRALSRAEIIGKVTNQTLVGLTPDGVEWYEYINDRGQVFYGASVIDNIYFGRWAMRGNDICFVYENRTPGVYYCHAIKQGENGDLWAQPTNFNFPASPIIKIVPGDAFELQTKLKTKQ